LAVKNLSKNLVKQFVPGSPQKSARFPGLTMLGKRENRDVTVSRFHSTPSLYTITYYDKDNSLSLILSTNESERKSLTLTEFDNIVIIKL